jgi:uncharacterized OsmC-like protein
LCIFKKNQKGGTTVALQTNLKEINGVNVEQLFGTIEAIKATPGIAKFKFSLRNKWLGGGHNRSTIGSFYGKGQENAREKPFVLDADEPQILLGEDNAPNPVEYLLKALAACVTTGIVYHAAARGIALEEVESTVEGRLDLRGFLGIAKSVRPGYQDIQMKFRFAGDLTDEQIEDLCKMGQAYSPVLDSVSRGVPVKVTGERKN